jgi:large subunit ribosomal protein L28
LIAEKEDFGRLRTRGVLCYDCPVFRKEITMARVCEVCGKGKKVGYNVSHAHNRTKRMFRPNLQPVRALIGATRKRILACTSCLKSGKVRKAV